MLSVRNHLNLAALDLDAVFIDSYLHLLFDLALETLDRKLLLELVDLIGLLEHQMVELFIGHF
jgi:hypothetical protein